MQTDGNIRDAHEAVGNHYEVAGMLEARRRTTDVIQEIAAAIHPGMTEAEGMRVARRKLKEADLLRGWHGIVVRFGENTVKDYSDLTDPDVVLKDSDIFFIDIGPVWKKWEGDGGDTFVIGDNPEFLAIRRDVHAVFDATQAKWRDQGLTGTDLYEFAASHAESLGWKMNLKMAGHRISDFPHAVHHQGTLANSEFSPSTGLWVLEVQIRHPTKPFGAFFEDILLADEAAAKVA
ncbi:M24 family metallopeptidase [Sphingosinicella rhizophila]|uniref:M24 family metallopeptidase n=1 Tax=Sphingosinicella rhizophila TaxID=3050082 RepID=A0ABU3Q5P1_9SPHN|nr:M24 family metallopeptidase [Sphingosinicella sp. GR2756]MDT9598724.1 M24 family metallopeptidase [Sphingosinicella sp. GR2756]